MVAILAGSLYACIYVGFRSREAALRAVEPAQRIGNVFTMLAQDLDGALPPTGTYNTEFAGYAGSAAAGGNASNGSNSNASGGLSSLGGSSAGKGLSAAKLNTASSGNVMHVDPVDPSAVLLLGFYSSSNTPRPDEFGSDLRKVEYSLETPELSKRPALVRHVYTNLAPSKQSVTRDQVLCRNVRSAYLRFYDGTVWQDTWDSSALSNALPLAVEMSLELDLPDPKLQPSEWPIYKMTRVFRIPCAVVVSTSSTGTGN